MAKVDRATVKRRRPKHKLSAKHQEKLAKSEKLRRENLETRGKERRAQGDVKKPAAKTKAGNGRNGGK